MKLSLNFYAFILLACVVVYLSCKKEYSCEGCKEKNKPPIAVAGPDQVITLPADSAILNGNASSDPDGMIRSYGWTKISGPASFNIVKPSDSITKVKALVVGNYSFELKVTDNGGLSAKDTVQIIVNDPLQTNRPPVAKAGPDQTISLPLNTITLDGSSSSDLDNNITSYLWTKISGPLSFNIVNTNAVQTQVTILVQGVYQFELTVTDAGSLFSKDTMSVTVNAAVSNNLSPIANAGPDISVNYDLQTCGMNPISIILNGSGSSDPDGSIVSYYWTGAGTISSPTTAVTQVTDLTPQAYSFILTVTDNTGATDTDTIQVTVTGINRQTINLQLIPFGTLSIPRAGIATAAAGNKILFAGGYTTSGAPGSGITNWHSRVDIYDMSTQTWSMAELSIARTKIGVVAHGNKIFFAGGYTAADDATNRVDIYDVVTNTWSTASLSEARINLAAVSAGNKVFFAGGCSMSGGVCDGPSDLVDVYDVSANLWSITSLSEARYSVGASSIGNQAFFAGGLASNGSTSRVDIYDAANNSWTSNALGEARGEVAGGQLGDKAFFGGGSISLGNSFAYSNKVDIYNNTTQSWSTACLSQSRIVSAAAPLGSRILFFPHGTRVDIYDNSLDTWFISDLSQPLYNSAVVGAGGQVYVAGGALNSYHTNYTSQVWRIQL